MKQTKNKAVDKKLKTKKPVKTVKFLFVSIIPLIMLAGTVILGIGNKSSIMLVTDNEVVEKDKNFFVDIYAVAGEPVNAIDFEITFDENKLSTAGIDKGESVFTIWTKEPEIKPGRIFVSGGTFKRGFIGKHKLVTIKFKPKQKGAVTLSVNKVNFLAGDGSGRNVALKEEGKKLDLYVHNTGDNLDEDLQDFLNNKKLVTDVDNDKRVTLVDISIFMSSWFKKDKIFDFNNDNKMTLVDFSIILADSFRY